MSRRDLAAFFALAFAISWGVPGLGLLAVRAFPSLPFSLEMYSPLYYAGVWGPALAAFLVMGRRFGSAGALAHARRILDWRLGWRWWLFALLGIPALYLVGALFEHARGTEGALAWYRGSWPALALAFALRATAGPVEEFGWRGFALPLLQRWMSPWAALLLLALVHALWHAPAFVIGFASDTHFATALPFPVAFARFLANILAVTVFLNVAYNATGGRLASAFLIHWMLNGLYPWEGDADGMTGQVVATGAAAAGMAATAGRKWLRAEHAATALPPEDS